jgi:hypothetical protein
MEGMDRIKRILAESSLEGAGQAILSLEVVVALMVADGRPDLRRTLDILQRIDLCRRNVNTEESHQHRSVAEADP